VITLGDVFRRFADDYMSAHAASIVPSHRRAIADILACRTPALGGHAHGAPEQRTTTVNRANGHRLGLHFDSWDMLPLPARGGSRYRMSVNIGTSDRYFLFVAMTAVEALQLAGQSSVGPQNATTVFRAALRARPQAPVFRLRVPAGWAYVAPTDNLPHDGSTIGAPGFDFSLHALADFRPLKHFFDTSTFLDLR
jgi:hypothetical protein